MVQARSSREPALRGRHRNSKRNLVSDALKVGARFSKRGNHTGDGIAEAGLAVEVRLPESLQELQVIAPASLVETFTDGVRSVTATWDATVLTTGRGAMRGDHRADDFPGGVKNPVSYTHLTLPTILRV